MRMSKIFVVVAAALLLASCGSSNPAPVQVIGGETDLAPLKGEWSGTYESAATGRSGSISFHLTDDPKGAHGDVLLVPRRDFVYPDQEHRHDPFGAASALSIEFVRISAGDINGQIAAYADPETPEAMLETHFSGHLIGNHIEGTFVTYSDHGVGPRRGTWKVWRKAS